METKGRTKVSVKTTDTGDPNVFTRSRLMSFLECERREWFKYQVEGAGVESVLPEDYFIEGEFGHYALAHWYKSNIMLRANMVKRIEKMLDGVEDVDVHQRLQVKLAAMVGACHAYKSHYASDKTKFKVLAVEQPFRILLGECPVEGVVDLIVEQDGEIGFIEHKFVSSFSTGTFESLPLNLQQLVYTMGTKQILNKEPKWYTWNMIRKSALRRKGEKPKKDEAVAHPESLLEYESRVTAQYLEEPESMFFRPPPRLVQPKAVESAVKSIIFHIGQWEKIKKSGEVPPMRYSSCTGMYGTVCGFGPACLALELGHGKGWDAPECRGMYRPKVFVNPELQEEVEEKDAKAK